MFEKLPAKSTKKESISLKYLIGIGVEIFSLEKMILSGKRNTHQLTVIEENYLSKPSRNIFKKL